MFVHVHTRSSAPTKEVCQVWMANSNVLSHKSWKSDCQTRVRQTIAPVMLIHCKNELLVFPWSNFSAVYVVRTATINSTCLLIQVEICCEMTILQQVEIGVISCHICRQSPLLLCSVCTNIKLIMELPICFREEQVKNDVTDIKFVTF